MTDVPFLCHYRRATEITDAHPYQEIARYCVSQRDRVDQVFATLAYFDGLNFAARARCAGLFSVGLMDEICPPSTVFAAYSVTNGNETHRHCTQFTNCSYAPIGGGAGHKLLCTKSSAGDPACRAVPPVTTTSTTVASIIIWKNWPSEYSSSRGR